MSVTCPKWPNSTVGCRWLRKLVYDGAAIFRRAVGVPPEPVLWR